MTIETNVLEPTPLLARTESGDTPSPLVGTLEAVETGLKEGVHEAGVTVEETAEAAREAIADAAHAVRDAVRSTGDAVETALSFPGRLVQRHPWLVLGAAALAAFVLIRRLRRE